MVRKSLYIKLIVIAICLSANVLFAKPIPVRNVKVDVQGKTALDARDVAMTKARQVAFTKLAAEHPEFGISSHEGVPPDRILEGLVIDYEVVREKMSSVRYIGVFNFNFNDRALQRYLSGSYKLVKPKSEMASGAPGPEDEGTALAGSRYVIIPVYISPDTSYLWEEDNPWSHYWSKQETRTKGKMAGSQFTLPLGDLRDIAGLTIEDAMMSKEQPLSQIIERYQGNVALIVILKSLDDGMNSHELQIKTHTRSGVFQPVYEPIVLQGQKGVTLDDIFKSAVQKSFAIVTGKGDIDMSASVEPSRVDENSQSNQEPGNEEPSNFKAVASFNNFQDWQAIRHALGRSNYIEDFDILNLNRQQAELQIKSRVSLSTLKGKLAQVGLRLDQSGGRVRLALPRKPVNTQEPVRHNVPSPFTPPPPPLAAPVEDFEIIDEEQDSESFQPEVIE